MVLENQCESGSYPSSLLWQVCNSIKVYCKVATETGKLANILRSIEGVADCLEDDFRAAMRYLIDNSVIPCSWHEVDAEEEENLECVRVAKVYAANSPPKPLENVSAPPLRVLGFSTICYSREGSPKPDRNPLLVISTATSKGEEKQFIANDDKNDNLSLKRSSPTSASLTLTS